MSQEIKIEKKSSDIIQPVTEKETRAAIRAHKDLSGAVLRGMNLDNLNAGRAILRKTDLAGTSISHGLLINPNFYRASLHGAAFNNTVCLGGDLVLADFKEADLSDSVLFGVDAEDASFESANLRDAALVNANLKNTRFNQANLSNARLASLDVTGADFSDADLTGAHAYRIDWSKAKIPPAVLPESFLQLPRWAWSVIICGVVGVIALVIYMLTRKKK